jgi:cathepsin A (carboxypeptidase C)
MYFEAEESPDTAPVVLWMDGGPGKSSLQAFFNGIGPVYAPDGNVDQLIEWPHSWNKKFNILSIDNPAGVGFSYAGGKDDLLHSDISIREDDFSFIKQFFQDSPELLDNPFYIVGLSYGGIYTPNLAFAIHSYNEELKLSNSPNVIPFKGFVVANPVTDFNQDPGTVNSYELFHQFGCLNDDLLQAVRDNNCTYSFKNVLPSTSTTKECLTLKDKIDSLTKDVGFDAFNMMNPYVIPPSMPVTPSIVEWANRKDVREALHVPSYVQPYSIRND